MKLISRAARLSGLILVIMAVGVCIGGAGAQEASLNSYLSQAKKLFDTGMENSQLSSETQRSTRMLRESIDKATDLINNYRENGLTNMPNFPNIPGLNMITRLPDKLLRAELSMLQDEIRMAQQMMQNPITATMNAPRDMASMLLRMAEQLEQ